MRTKKYLEKVVDSLQNIEFSICDRLGHYDSLIDKYEKEITLLKKEQEELLNKLNQNAKEQEPKATSKRSKSSTKEKAGK